MLLSDMPIIIINDKGVIDVLVMLQATNGEKLPSAYENKAKLP